MKRYGLWVLAIGFIQAAVGQDYIITWDNDTVACRFPERPRKEGLRPAWKFENGHIRVPAVFSGDSMRVVEAGQIKGYSRKDHGKSLLCDGFFEAKKVGNTSLLVSAAAPKRKDEQWYFMNRVLEGKFASLYMIYLPDRNAPQPLYFVTKHNHPDPLTAFSIWNKQSARILLAETEIKTEMEKFLSGKRRKFIDMVKEYNRLKETLSYPAP